MDSLTQKFTILACDIFSDDKKKDTEVLRAMLENDSIDWSTFFAEGIRQRYLPAVYYRLSQLGLLGYIAETDIVKKMENEYTYAKAHNDNYIEEIRLLLKSINSKKLKAVLLKGEVLSCKYYPAPETRPFGDCDLLLDKSEIREIENILLENGYTQGYGADGKITKPSRREIFFARLYMKHIIAYVKYQGDMLFVIEPHYNLLWRNKDGDPAFDLSMNSIIDRACEIDFEGSKSWRMQNEDFLIFLCIDIYEDANRIEKIVQGTDLELIKFLDAYSVVRDGIDWNIFIERITEVKMNAPVYFTLDCLNKLYNIVPHWVLTSIKPNSTAYVDEFGFPEEIIGENRCTYKRGFMDRLFDHEYRLDELKLQKELCKNTTFQNLQARR